MSSSALLDLPNELLIHLTTFIHPSAILSYVLSCKQAHQLATKQLARNRDYHEEYRVSHDRQPLNVPTLLRRALADQTAAWHMRSLEFWGTRPEWKNWTSYLFYHANPFGYDDPKAKDWPEPFEDHSSLDYLFFDSEELCQYRDIISKQLLCSDTTPEVSTWMEKIENGDDEKLKCMLIAVLPRLERLKFVAYSAEQERDPHPLLSFGASIEACLVSVKAGQLLWPPGFASLRTVSVCACTDMQHPHDAFYAPASAIAPLFRLPNIETLNLSLLGYLDEPDPDYDLPANSSSVKNLYFYCTDLEHTDYMNFIGSAVSLRSLRFGNCGPSASALVEFLADHYGHCLEVLGIDRTQSRRETYLFDPLLLQRFTALKVLEPLQLSDIAVKPTDSGTSSIITSGLPETLFHGLEALLPKELGLGMQIADLKRLLPSSIESITILSSYQRASLPMDDKDDQLSLLTQIAELGEDARHASLREVCLWHVRCTDVPDWTMSCDTDLVRRIEAQRITLHRPARSNDNEAYVAHQALHPSERGTLETEPEGHL